MFYIRCHNQFQMRTKKYKQSEKQQLNKQKHRQKIKKKQQAHKDMKPPVINIKRCVRSSASFMWADWSVINNCHINRQRWWEMRTVPSILQLQRLIVNDHKSNFLSRKQETLGLVAGGRWPVCGTPKNGSTTIKILLLFKILFCFYLKFCLFPMWHFC